MESSSKRISGKKLLFGELPPRVIIHDILSFYKLVVNLELLQKDQYILFGLFTRDRGRNLWLVFTTVSLTSKVCENLQRNSLPIDVGRLFSLSLRLLGEGQREVLEQLAIHSKEMFSLRTLLVDCDDFHWIDRSLLRMLNFPHIKALMINSNLKLMTKQTSQSQSVIERSFLSFFQNLEELKLKTRVERVPYSEELGKTTLFRQNEDRFCNLKKLGLYNITSSFPVTLIVPKLEVISLECVKNISIKPGNRLIQVVLDNMENRNQLTSLMKNSPRLKSLDVSGYPSNMVPFKFVHDSSCNKLESLKNLLLVSYGLGFRFTPIDVVTLFKLKDQLESLHIFQGNFEYDIFSQNEFKTLRKLYYYLIPFVELASDLQWPVSLNLKGLILSNGIRCEELFSLNEWPVLEFLNVRVSSNTTGVGWNKLPNLETLKIEKCMKFSDTFFQEHDELKNLKDLTLEHCDGLSGENWNDVISKNLEKLRINACHMFKDQFFQETRFLTLKHLKLISCPQLTGSNWKKFGSMERMVLIDCENITISNLRETNHEILD